MKLPSLERNVPIVAGVLFALPLLVFRGVPMTDLAHHEGMVALLAHAGDNAFTRGIYALNLGHANQLFYALAWPLALLFGSGLACRIVVAAIVLATFAATAKLCDHTGASRWAALLVAPAAMGWTFFFGFAPNLLGVALFLAFLPRVDAFVETPTVRGTLVSSGLVVLLHFAHETSAICACVAIVVFALGRRGSILEWIFRAVPIAIAALLAFIEMRREEAVLTTFGRRWIEKGIELHPIDKKLEHVLDFVMGPHGSDVEWLVAAFSMAALIAFAIEKRKRRPTAKEPAPSLRESLVRYRYELMASTFFALYVAAPFSINFGAFLYVRFLAPAYVLAIIAVARGANASPIVKGFALAVPIAWLTVVVPVFADADRERAAVDALLPQIAEGSAFAVIGLGGQGEARPYDPIALGNRALAARGGRALHSFTEYPIAPVVIRNGLRWDEAVMRIYINPPSLRPAFDFTRFRYVLARIPDEGRAALVARAIEPDATLAGSSGPWRLFVSTHDTVAIDSPDALLPKPPPPTIQERVNAILAGP